MDDMTQAPQSKVHTWMLILLTWIAVFSIVIVGILLTRNSSSNLSSSEIAAACQNGTTSGIASSLTKISEACNADSATAAATTTMAIEGAPTFSYPVGWQFAVNKNLVGGKHTIIMNGNSGPIVTGTDTEGPFVPFYLLAGTKTDLPMNEFPKDGTVTNGPTTVKILSNGTLTTTTTTTTTGAMNDFTGELEEFIFFVGQTQAVKITLPDPSIQSEAQKADLAVIINSLDFSSIK